MRLLLLSERVVNYKNAQLNPAVDSPTFYAHFIISKALDGNTCLFIREDYPEVHKKRAKNSFQFYMYVHNLLQQGIEITIIII